MYSRGDKTVLRIIGTTPRYIFSKKKNTPATSHSSHHLSSRHRSDVFHNERHLLLFCVWIRQCPEIVHVPVAFWCAHAWCCHRNDRSRGVLLEDLAYERLEGCSYSLNLCKLSVYVFPQTNKNWQLGFFFFLDFSRGWSWRDRCWNSG